MRFNRTLACTLAMLIATLCLPGTSRASDEALAKYVPTDAVFILEFNDPEKINRIMLDMLQGMKLPGMDIGRDRTISQEAGEGIFGRNNSPVDPKQGVMMAMWLGPPSQPGFGAQPEPQVIMIFHAAAGRDEAPKPRDPRYKTTRIIDGIVIASYAADWSPPAKPCPLLDSMRPGDVSAAVDFNAIWKEFGPVVEMSVGMAIAMSGQHYDKPAPKSLLDSLWATIDDIDTVRAAARFTPDDVLVDAQVTTKSPVTDRPDGEGLANLASHLPDESMMVAMDLFVMEWLQEVVADVVQVVARFTGQEKDSPPGLEKMAERIDTILKSMYHAEKTGIVMSMDIATLRGVKLTRTDDVQATMKKAAELTAEVALVPEFMKITPIQGTPYAWKMESGPFLEALTRQPGMNQPRTHRLVEVDPHTMGEITGPLDWNPLEKNQSNVITKIYAANKTAPPAVAVAIDLGKLVHHLGTIMAPGPGHDATPPQPARLTMTMTPHEGHWDANINLPLKKVMRSIEGLMQKMSVNGQPIRQAEEAKPGGR